ncbi:MAG: L,D-transpeptidase [Candidatus Kapabacteria bacterium]|nr:L,D-transpeptidase [Candidatus Kapabacteria bacterium]MDW8011751.1 L,D-transpeptidase [Bacteroidota bacterium]
MLRLLLHCIAWLLLSTPFEGGPAPAYRAQSSATGIIPTSFLRFFPRRDTIYTLSPWYLELNLQRQRLYLVSRNGERQEFRVSSGTPWIAGGIETPTGLFTLQTKATLAISRQFDNTRMLYWMGFSGNVGFHALEGWSYYRHLGVRPSSHGCVRLSREDARYLYHTLRRGTPVLVYSREPARVLSFLLPEEFDPHRDWLLGSDFATERRILQARLQDLYSGRIRYPLRRAALDGSTVLPSPGYPIGSADSIPSQEPPLLLSAAAEFLPVPASNTWASFYSYRHHPHSDSLP